MTAPGTVLSDVIIWFRRYVKEGDTDTLPDDTCIEYINRFYLYKMPQRLQLFDLRRQFAIELQKASNYYLFPKNNYENLFPPVFVDGVEIGYYQSTAEFYRNYPEQIFNEQPITGDGTASYTHTLTNTPVMKSFFDKSDPSPLVGFDRYRIANFIISAFNASGEAMILVDDGAGTLEQVDNTYQTLSVPNGGGTINYTSGLLSFTFNAVVPSGNEITIQSIPYVEGRPTGVYFHDNYLKVFPVPDRQYKLQFEAQITPAQFLLSTAEGDPNPSSQLLPQRYMAEYIALGSALIFMKEQRKEEQLRFYLPLFKEEENELLRRTERQKNTQRTQTIFSQQTEFFGNNSYNRY